MKKDYIVPEIDVIDLPQSDVIATSSLEQEENKLQHTILDIKNKYGKNSIIKGMNIEEGATGIDRNNQIGGHRK